MEYKYKHNKALVPKARALRKSMTKEEKRLWYDFLKPYSEKVLRQKIVGNYIVDFYCPSAKIVIEVDGSQHYTLDGLCKKDEIRSKELESFGLTVIRVLNVDINKNFSKVCSDLDFYISEAINNKK